MWLTGPVAPRHVGSSQTRAGTRVPCISRQTLNHCATREALPFKVVWSFEVVCVLHFRDDSMVLVSLRFGLGEGGYLKDYEWVVGERATS